jgi:cation transport ATPase
MITGESIPVAKGVHSRVYAGTTNGGGMLIVRLTTLPHENSVHKIAAMVENAELSKYYFETALGASRRLHHLEIC